MNMKAEPAPAALPPLRYVTDSTPGIVREGKPGAFRYRGPAGRLLRDAATLARIRKLAIPPAWAGVWICADESGHLQATGRDARGRKQYRYHARWRTARDENKYERLKDFVTALPAIRARVDLDLRRQGLPREKVLATVVRLLETTLIRVGNEKYARENGSFGLTTMRNRHLRLDGEHMQFEFRGKSGKSHRIAFSDARLAGIVRRCRELPGQELFQYLDEKDEPQPITSTDVNDYLSAASGGQPYTAKDFRTWAGTVLAAIALRQQPAPGSQASRKRHINDAVRMVAQKLGNTPAICRKCYIHPRVLDAYDAEDLTGLPKLGMVEFAGLQLTRRHEMRVLRMLGAAAPSLRDQKLLPAAIASKRRGVTRPRPDVSATLALAA
jgi:DNA topoisomerase I